MKKVFVLLMFLSYKFYSQTKEVVPYPKGKLFVGAEIGNNSITSYKLGEGEGFIHGGFLAEYYFAKRWSISIKAKYFKIGSSFCEPSKYETRTTGSLSNLFGGSSQYTVFLPEQSRRFDGEVINFPVYLKWQFRIYKNLVAGIKAGPGFAIETKQSYTNYTSNIDTNFKSQYMSINKGLEINYFINKKTIIYIDFEDYSGASKGGINGNKQSTSNNLTSIGFKYSFMD